ncbi:hypothetical protein GDO78_022083 [Eleutherodactylus coqui]|uniref:Uncharacterized protein n=1 Tax=Eleutherodactylus coqui TaxID=57060 RepID=A0A8J6JY48_ELECQ|nr:hypothetical protein GDO78_022083 [Eleutherodactylus coqui]
MYTTLYVKVTYYIHSLNYWIGSYRQFSSRAAITILRLETVSKLINRQFAAELSSNYISLNESHQNKLCAKTEQTEDAAGKCQL